MLEFQNCTHCLTFEAVTVFVMPIRNAELTEAAFWAINRAICDPKQS
jgi:hypothetical protein